MTEPDHLDGPRHACPGCHAELEALQAELERRALAWAAADRAADDRAADVQGLERVIADGDRPVPDRLLIARDAANTALRDACKAEGDADQDLRAAAKRLLDKTTTTKG